MSLLGLKLYTSPRPMQLKDLRQIVEYCFKLSTVESMYNGCLILWDFHSFGRIEEMFALKKSDLDVYESNSTSALQMPLTRGKVSLQQCLLFMSHATSFIMCPIHNLARSELISVRSSDQLFCAGGSNNTGST